MTKRLLPLLLAVALVFCAAIAPMTASAAGTNIAITVDKPEAAVGDTVKVTVAFTALDTNISVFEIVIPIDANAFEYVEGSAEGSLEAPSGTSAGCAFRTNKSDVLCNWVNVEATIPANSTTICTFDLKVKAAGTVALSGDSFMSDKDDVDIAFTSSSAEVKVSGAVVPTPTPVVTPTPTPVVTPMSTPTTTVKPSQEPDRPTPTPTVEVPSSQDPLDPGKTGDSTTLTIVLACVLVLAAVATSVAVLSKKEN